MSQILSRRPEDRTVYGKGIRSPLVIDSKLEWVNAVLTRIIREGADFSRNTNASAS